MANGHLSDKPGGCGSRKPFRNSRSPYCILYCIPYTVVRRKILKCIKHVYKTCTRSFFISSRRRRIGFVLFKIIRKRLVSTGVMMKWRRVSRTWSEDVDVTLYSTQIRIFHLTHESKLCFYKLN